GGRGKAAGLRLDQWDPNTGYPRFSGWSPPLLGVLASTSESIASYPVATHGSAVTLGVSALATSDSPESLLTLDLERRQNGDENGTLTVTLAATKPTELEINMNNSLKEVELPAGITSYPIGRANGQA